MFSKLLVLVFSVSLFVGCAGEDQSKNDVLQIKKPGNSSVSTGEVSKLKCLSGFNETFSSYLAGKMSAAEINEFWGCFDSIAELFIAYSKVAHHLQTPSAHTDKLFVNTSSD